MLTFSFEAHCLPAGTFTRTGTQPHRQGAAGQLVVALVGPGRCLVGGHTAPAGMLVAGAGPLAFSPQGPCRVHGLVLEGAVPAAVAAGMDAPQLWNGTHCAEAVLLLRSLAGEDTERTPALQSAQAYTLLCRLAAADASAEESLPLLVAAAVGHIQQHYAEVYGVEELAAALGVSKSHLIRSFTAATGTSPGKYLTTVRVENAKRLLAGPPLPLQAVASLCGFSGANYLCRVFKQQTGTTPAAWRRLAAPGAAVRPATGLEEQLYL
ncbi:AraC family transcriptional regulator [Ruminococcaceae bacterium OttesenSCG-928-O06]|nr:AraC family transcriptional regulator [Ruminococcaceae bacterium OttesenSCG-928-O06]